MKNKLLINSEMIEALFIPPYKLQNSEIIVFRLKRNLILINRQIREAWYEYFEEKGMDDVFRGWIQDNSHNEDSLLKTIKNTDIEEVDGLFHLLPKIADNLDFETLVVGNYDNQTIRKYPKVKFVLDIDFGSPKINLLTLSHLEDIKKSGGRFKNWFSLYETKISIQVEKNKDSNLLAQFLSKFIFGDSVIIQDLWLTKNKEHEKNLDTYIYPLIKHMKNITIIIDVKDGTDHKSRLERKYKAKVICYPKDDIHQGFIKTDKYIIDLGYRFEVFGPDGKTKREKIHIDRVQ